MSTTTVARPASTLDDSPKVIVDDLEFQLELDSITSPIVYQPSDELDSKLTCLSPDCEKDGYNRHLQHLRAANQQRAGKAFKKDKQARRRRGIFAERRQHARTSVAKVERRENIAALEGQFDELSTSEQYQNVSIRIPLARLAS